MAKHALFHIKILNLLHSKNSLFHLFIFLISLSIGFVCAFYFQNVSTSIQTFVFHVFHSLSVLQISPTLTQSISPTLILSPSSSPPPMAFSHEDILSLSRSSEQEPQPPPPPLLLAESVPSTPPPLLLAESIPPTPPPVSLAHGDTLSLSPSPLPQSPPSSLSLSPPTPPSSLSPSPQTPPSSLSPSPSPHTPPLSLSPSPSPQPPPSSLSPSPSTQTPPSSLSPSPSPSPQPQPPPSLLLPTNVSMKEQIIPRMHNMSDEDLVTSVITFSTMSSSITNAPYKVAFMFLTPGPLPLSPLWELFFKGHSGLFSIYVHPHPSYNDTISEDSVFYGTRITSQPVYWGDISMVDAERRLLANALLDQSNQRFVLLSDSCIPLFNFTTIYNYLVNSDLSYINSFDDKRKSGRGRYNQQMSPNITIEDWRKGSQWFEVNRDLALEIVVEKKFYSLFKELCHPPCYNDEHYLPTMVNILYGNMNSNRSVTYVDWSKPAPHPRKFLGRDITEEFLNSIRFGSTQCIYNGNTTPMCMLFARKFAPGTLNPLLNFAPLMFGSNA